MGAVKPQNQQVLQIRTSFFFIFFCFLLLFVFSFFSFFPFVFIYIYCLQTGSPDTTGSLSFPGPGVGREWVENEFGKGSQSHQSRPSPCPGHPDNPCSCLQDICKMPLPSRFCATFGTGTLCEAVFVPTLETHSKAFPLQLWQGRGLSALLPPTSSPEKLGFFVVLLFGWLVLLGFFSCVVLV